MKEVSKEEFYNSKYITDPAHGTAVSVDGEYPYTVLFKLKQNHNIVGKITPERRYFIKA